MKENQVWVCGYCKKTFKDPSGSASYFHKCKESKREGK